MEKTKATLRNVASACGVDVSTVSRALRRDPRVNEKTREKIQACADKLGYRPNLAARALVAGRSRVIWFLLPSLRFTLEQIPAQHADEYLGEHGYDMMAVLYRDDPEVYRRQLERLSQGMADGAIIVPGGLDDQGRIRKLLDSGFPLVFLDRWPWGLPDAARVVSNNRDSTEELMLRLKAAGAKSVISLFGTGNNAERERCYGTRNAAEKLKMQFQQYEPGLTVIQHRFLESALAVVGSSQQQILEFVRARHELLKQKIFFGCYDQWYGSPSPAEKVVIVKQDFKAMGRQSAKLLLDMIQNKVKSDNIRIPVLDYQILNSF